MRFGPGVTLIELLVVLVLLGLLLSVTGLAVGSLRAPGRSSRFRALEAARATAIRSGRPVAVQGDSGVVRFFPDGRALGPGVDPWTGAPDAPR
jgi:prepilin-type N-terminal cleavage/methylation domain-containing protein